MTAKRILTIRLNLAAPEATHAEFDSKTSLLEWDIVLFKPSISEFTSYGDFFQGKGSLSDSLSFQLRECCAHWKREIKQSVEAGETVIVHLPGLDEVYVDSGRREYSGTGGNRRTTRIVDLYSDYQAIPADVSPVTATGSSMKLSARGAEVLAPYWSEFESESRYEVVLSSPRGAKVEETDVPGDSTQDRSIAVQRRQAPCSRGPSAPVGPPCDRSRLHMRFVAA